MKNIKGYIEYLRESREGDEDRPIYNQIVYSGYHHNSLDVLKGFLEKGLDPNTTNEEGVSLLNGIISVGNLSSSTKIKMMELLIQAGADVNPMTTGDVGTYKDIKQTPLMDAVGKMNRDIVKLLLEAGADPNLTGTDKGGVPISLAVFNEDLETLKLLIEAGAKAAVVDPNLGTLLQIYFKGSRGVPDSYAHWFYLSNRRWLNEGSMSRPEIIMTLINAGADPNGVSEINKIPPIISAVRSWFYHKYGFRASKSKRMPPELGNVEALLRGGADPNAKDGNGTTVLWHACTEENRPIVKALLEAGADPNQGELIAVGKKSAIVRDLLQAGADPNTKLKDGEPLIKAWVRWDHKNSVKELIKTGADPLEAFDSIEEMEKFFGGKTSWVPKQAMEKMKKRNRARGAFGRF
jgi:cytohesin